MVSILQLFDASWKIRSILAHQCGELTGASETRFWFRIVAKISDLTTIKDEEKYLPRKTLRWILNGCRRFQKTTRKTPIRKYSFLDPLGKKAVGPIKWCLPTVKYMEAANVPINSLRFYFTGFFPPKKSILGWLESMHLIFCRFSRMTGVKTNFSIPSNKDLSQVMRLYVMRDFPDRLIDICNMFVLNSCIGSNFPIYIPDLIALSCVFIRLILMSWM